jgi:hypothetical protein
MGGDDCEISSLLAFYSLIGRGKIESRRPTALRSSLL